MNKFWSIRALKNSCILQKLYAVNQIFKFLIKIEFIYNGIEIKFLLQICILYKPILINQKKLYIVKCYSCRNLAGGFDF